MSRLRSGPADRGARCSGRSRDRRRRHARDPNRRRQRRRASRRLTPPTRRHGPEIAQAVQEALRAWPAGTVRRLRILAERYPRSGLVRLELGLALVLTGQQADATKAWLERQSVSSPIRRRRCVRRTSVTRTRRPTSRRSSRASPSRRARFRPGSCAAPPFSRRFDPSRPNASSRRLRRSRLADPEALTAAAVGLYDKDRPALAFSHLGPAGSPVSARADRPLPSRPALDLLRGRGPVPAASWPSPARKAPEPRSEEGRIRF